MMRFKANQGHQANYRPLLHAYQMISYITVQEISQIYIKKPARSMRKYDAGEVIYLIYI
jgi:predicted transcriptional regulator